MVSLSHGGTLPLVPNVVVVDPQFQAYGPLVAAARAGRLNLHLRATGAEGLKLARRLDVDAWLVSSDLDDMAGDDFVALLDAVPGRSSHSVAMVSSSSQQPISMDTIETLLRAPAKEVAERPREGMLGRVRALLSLPIGVGAAVIAIAALMNR